MKGKQKAKATRAASKTAEIDIRLDGAGPGHLVSERLLGHNLECALDTVPGMLTNRLRNYKFLGPAHPTAGTAPEWWYSNDVLNGQRLALVPAASPSGGEAQIIQNFTPGMTLGICQNRIPVRAGEALEVELWARAWRRPATLHVGLLPGESRFPPLAGAAVKIETAHWKCYTLSLRPDRTDCEAVFYMTVEDGDQVWIGQAWLRAAGEGVVSRDVLDCFASLRIPVLRFPGGVASTAYNWRNSVGPVHRRPVTQDAVFKRTSFYDFGTDEFLELCLAQGITPLITLNLACGTPEDAGEWAAYCAKWFAEKGKKPPLMYFQIGNHPYLSAEISYMTPQMYLSALREYVPAVKAAYPKARILGVTPPERGPWRSAVMEAAAGLLDVVAIQAYGVQPACAAGAGPDGLPEAGADEHMAGVVAQVGQVAGYLRETIADCAATDRNLKTALVEWNLWGTASHRDGRNFTEPYDAAHGLFIAGMIHEMAGMAQGIELATFYHLLNPMGLFVKRGLDVEETCGAEVFRLYRPAFPGKVTGLSFDSPGLGDGRALDALCLSQKGRTWLFLANRSASRALSVSCKEFQADKAQAKMLRGAYPLDTLRPAKVEIQQGALILPPLSIVRIERKS